MRWYRQLHWQILMGMALGLVFGLIAARMDVSPEHLFSVPLDPGTDLDQQKLSDPLRHAFQNADITLEENSTVIVVEAGKEWRIDSGSASYIVRRVGKELKIFKPGKDDFFNIPFDPGTDLDQQKLSDPLQQAFQKADISLEENPTVVVVEAGKEWRIDSGSASYIVKRVGKELKIFKPGQDDWAKFTTNWIKPWGTIFINLLKLVAVPLVLASLISGVASLSDVSRLSRIGGKTIGIYLGTTALAVTIGLVVVNVMKPGKTVPKETSDQLLESYEGEVSKRAKTASEVKEQGPLKPVVDIVTDNPFASFSDNGRLLQVVFVAILIGIGLIKIDPVKALPVRGFFEGLNDVVIAIVEMIMYLAPVGVFALIASVITDLGGNFDIIKSLAFYGLAVIIGLALHLTLVYLGLLSLFTPLKLRYFFQQMRPVYLLAFSSSSSAATLPLTKKCCDEGLGVDGEISSFTLPLGATINMDGTALYQAVAAVFIAQTLGIDLTIGQQLTILFTAVLASVGTAAVPSAGIIMLVIILEATNPALVPGIALILAIDRPLDMMRTMMNVTGDAVVTTMVAHSEHLLHPPGTEPTLPPDAIEQTEEAVKN